VNGFGSPIQIEIRNTTINYNALAVWSPQYPVQQDFALFVENV
jgi:hypothetical protein